MKPQTLYRGGESKKEKPSKADKVFEALRRERLRNEARAKTKKEA
jgi:hypothetical protein